MSDRFAEHRAELAELAAARTELRRADYDLVARTRAAALKALAAGMPEEEVAPLARVSAATIERWFAASRRAGARTGIATSVDAKVLRLLREAAGPIRQRDVVLAAGLRSGTVSKSVRRLVATGRAITNPDGTVSPVQIKGRNPR